MNYLTVLCAIFCIFTFSSACYVRNSDDVPKTTQPPLMRQRHRGRMLGGVSQMSEEEFEEPIFQDAVKELMKKLDEANDCYTFELLKVIEGTKQLVSGMKYNVKLEVKPVFNGDGKSECSYSGYSNVGSAKEVEASIWSQPWRHENPHKVTFKADSVSGDFVENGKMSLH
ncbi:hypothetical protein Aperf_G00000035733 [Anoplocephala perfoliata]